MFDAELAKIEMCESADEVIMVVNYMLSEARKYSAAVRQLGDFIPVRSAAAISLWVQRLKAAAGVYKANEAMHIFPPLYAALRTALRRLELLE
jgi:hypothetical protein